MMKKWKKLLSGFLVAALTFTLIPSTGSTVEAATVRIPTKTLETIPEGEYKVPMRLYTAESDADVAEYSMGDNYIGFGTGAGKYATVKVTEDKISVTMAADIDAGMNYFAYFDSAETYAKYQQARKEYAGSDSGMPDDLQNLQKDIESAPEDLQLNVEKHTVVGNGQSAEVDCITEITMKIDACVPVYYAGFNAIGMAGGTETKYAQIGFDWSKLEKTSESGGDGGEVTPQENIIVTRYNELKEYFNGLNAEEYITEETVNENGWVTLEKFFETWDASVEDGSADLTQLKTELQSVYQKAYDPVYMRKKSANADLKNGYTYKISAKWYPAVDKTYTFTDEEGDLESFTVKVPDYEGTGEYKDLIDYVNDRIESTTITVQELRNALTIHMDLDKQTSGVIPVVETFFGYADQIGMGEKYAKVHEECVYLEEDEYTYLENYYMEGLAYLYAGAIPLQVSLNDWEAFEWTEPEGFLVVDYDSATIVGSSGTTTVDKSSLEELYNSLEKYTEGYGEYKEKETSASYMYAPEVVEKLSAEDGPLAEIREALDNGAVSQREVDTLYETHKDFLKTATTLRAAYEDNYYDRVSEWRELLKETEAYTPNSLQDLKDALDYIDAFENLSTSDPVTVDGKTVYGYLPGENIELTQEEYEVYKTITQADLNNGNLSEEQTKAYNKMKLLQQIVLRDYNPKLNPDVDPTDPESWEYLAANYYRYRAMQKVDAALAGLEKYGDTTELNNLIAELEAITGSEEESAKYTRKSIADLKSAVEDAKEKVSAGKLLETEVAELTTSLNDAKAALVDRTALKAALDHAKELIAQADKYTEVSLSIYNAEYVKANELYTSNRTVTAVQIAAQVASLEAAEQSLVEKSTEDLDKDNLADGKYMVDINLWHATQDKESMGNQALYHHGILTVKDGKYSLLFVGHEVTVGNITGELAGIQVKPGGTAEEDWVTPDTVDGAGKGNYAFTFELTSKGEKEYLPSRIKVEEGTPMGTDWIESRMRISWDTLKKTGSSAGIDEIISGEIVTDPTGPIYQVDSTTGVIVQAAEGVFPEGTTIVVTKGSLARSGMALGASLVNYVNQYEMYTITAYTPDGEEVQPDGVVTLSLPVPDEYDSSKLAVYQLESSGTLRLLSGEEEDGLYTVDATSLGQFAIAERKSTTVKKPNNTTPTKTTTTTKTPTTTTRRTTTTTTPRTTTTKASTAKTGDQANIALYGTLLALAAVAGAVVVIRRRKSEYSKEK